ncbi:hypothetical protein ACLOJK_031490 [Asimina triloba]
MSPVASPTSILRVSQRESSYSAPLTLSCDVACISLTFHCSNDAENGTSKATEERPIEKDQAGNDHEDNVSRFSSKVCSTDAYLSDVDSEESRNRDLHLKDKRNSNPSALASTGHSKSCCKKDLSESGEHGEGYGGNDSDIRTSWTNGKLTYEGRRSVCAAKIQSNYSMQFKVDKSLDEQGEISQQLGQCSSESLRSSENEMEEITGFSGLKATYEEGMSDPKFLYTSGSPAKSQTARNSNTHDGSVSSSGDGHEVNGHTPRPPLSKRTLPKQQSSVGSVGTKGRPAKDGIFLNDNMSTDWGIRSRKEESVAMSLKDNNCLHVTENVYTESCKSSQIDGYEHQAPKQGKMQDSEVFQAVQKWVDSQMERPQQFPSQDHGMEPPNVYQNELLPKHRHQDFLCTPNSFAPGNLKDGDLNQKELLRKLEDLRDQLRKSCNLWGNEKENRQLVFYDNDPQQEHLQCHDAWDPSGMSRARKSISRQSGSSRECAVNSRHHVGYSCLNCHPSGQHFSNQFCSTSCPSQGLCKSSAGPMLYHPFSLSPPQMHLDHNVVKHYKEKQQLKRHCRPIAGAAPFVVCYRCFKLLQLPADFLLSRAKRHRLQCGACSKLLIFSIHNNTHLSPYSPTQVTCPTGQINGGTNAIARDTKPIVDADGFHHRDTISYSDDSSYSIPKSYFTEGEPITLAPSFLLLPDNLADAEHNSRGSLEHAEERIKPSVETSGNESEREAPQSVSPSLDGAKPEQTFFEGNITAQFTGSPLHQLMGYSSPTEMIYGLPNGVDASEGLDIEILSDSLSSEYQTELSEEDETLKSTYNKSSSFLPYAKNRMEEFNNGSDNAKVSVNGRVIPDHLVKRAEEKAGPIQPGNYWYDSRAGFWGVIGQACLGIILPFIEELNYPMRKDCAGGNTGILVNGRELHQKDLNLLSNRGLPTGKNRAYVIEFEGRVIDEESGEPYNLGKLAPTCLMIMDAKSHLGIFFMAKAFGTWKLFQMRFIALTMKSIVEKLGCGFVLAEITF